MFFTNIYFVTKCCVYLKRSVIPTTLLCHASKIRFFVLVFLGRVGPLFAEGDQVLSTSFRRIRPHCAQFIAKNFWEINAG